MTHRERKQAIRDFMQEHYTDERLAWLLAHARAGKLAYDSCCCFVGIPQAPHALKGSGERGGSLHYGGFRRSLAEEAFLCIDRFKFEDEGRRRILIPMIRAEMRRRARLLPTPAEQPEAACIST